MVTQLQLEKIIYARRKMQDSRREYQQMRREIIELLEAGAGIQHGVHTAELQVCEGCKLAGSNCSRAKLVFG